MGCWRSSLASSNNRSDPSHSGPRRGPAEVASPFTTNAGAATSTTAGLAISRPSSGRKSLSHARLALAEGGLLTTYRSNRDLFDPSSNVDTSSENEQTASGQMASGQLSSAVMQNKQCATATAEGHFPTTARAASCRPSPHPFASGLTIPPDGDERILGEIHGGNRSHARTSQYDTSDNTLFQTPSQQLLQSVIPLFLNNTFDAGATCTLPSDQHTGECKPVQLSPPEVAAATAAAAAVVDSGGHTSDSEGSGGPVQRRQTIFRGLTRDSFLMNNTTTTTGGGGCSGGYMLHAATAREGLLQSDASWPPFHMGNPLQVKVGPLLGRGGCGSVYQGTWRGRPVAIKVVQQIVTSPCGPGGGAAAGTIAAPPPCITPLIDFFSSSSGCTHRANACRPGGGGAAVPSHVPKLPDAHASVKRLRHPNVLRTYAYAAISTTPQLDGVLPSRHEHHVVLELCNGGSLRAWLDRVRSSGSVVCTASGMGKAAVTQALWRARVHISGSTSTTSPPQAQHWQQQPALATAAEDEAVEEEKAVIAGELKESASPPEEPAAEADGISAAAAASAAAGVGVSTVDGMTSSPIATAISAPDGIYASAAVAAAAATVLAAATAATSSASQQASGDLQAASQALSHPASRRLPGLTEAESQQLMLLTRAWIAEAGSSELATLTAAAASVSMPQTAAGGAASSSAAACDADAYRHAGAEVCGDDDADAGYELRRCSRTSAFTIEVNSSDDGSGDTPAASGCGGDASGGTSGGGGSGGEPRSGPERSSVSSSLAAGPLGLGSPVTASETGPGPPPSRIPMIASERDTEVALPTPLLEEALTAQAPPPPTADLAAAWAGATLQLHGNGSGWIVDHSTMARPGSSAGSMTSGCGRRPPSVVAHHHCVILDDVDEQDEYDMDYGGDEYEGSTSMYGTSRSGGGGGGVYAIHDCGSHAHGGGSGVVGMRSTRRMLYGGFGASMVDEPLRRLEEEYSAEGTQSSRGRSRGDATGTATTGITMATSGTLGTAGGADVSLTVGKVSGSCEISPAITQSSGRLMPAKTTAAAWQARAAAPPPPPPPPPPQLLLTAEEGPPPEGELELAAMTSVLNRRAVGMVRSIMLAAAADGEAAAPPSEPMCTAKLRHLVAALECLVEVAAGLSYLHGVGMVHGDVKSSNVLLQLDEGLVRPHPHSHPQAGRGFRLKLADFGFARVLEHGSHTYLSRPSGTLAYLSPELLTSYRQSTAADQYAFGLLVWEVVTTEPLFRCMQTPQVLYAKTHNTDWQHLQWPPWVPPEVRALARRCADYQPSQRLTAAQARPQLEGMRVRYWKQLRGGGGGGQAGETEGK